MRLSRRASHVALAATLVAVPSAVLLATGSPATAVEGPAFSPAVPLFDDSGASTLGAEPSIEVDSHGEVYVSAPAGVPTGGCPFWDVHPDRVGANHLPYDYRGTIDTDHGGAGGGDCDISITPAATAGAAYDQVSVTSLSLANLTSNTTSDGGQTFFPVANNASQQVFGVDRQWQASDPALGRHYLSVHDLATTNIQMSVSTDGGYQYVQNTPAVNVTEAPGAVGLGGNHFGTTVVNPVTHKLYIPFLAPGPDEATGGEEHAVWVAEGDPCATVPCVKGQPAGPITWTDHLVYTAPDDAKLSHIFPAIAIDAGGTVYVAWTGDTTAPGTTSSLDQHVNRVFLTHSSGQDVSAGGWTAPVAVDGGDGHSNMFPWLIAGAPGQVAAVWYTADLVDTGADCAGRSGVLGDAEGVNNNCGTDWSVAYAQTSDGTSPAPSFVRTRASGVMHRGSVCDSGTTCLTIGGDRTLLDFFDVALDPQGRPNIAFVSDVRSPGTADVQYTRLCTGTSLTGVDVPGPCQPIGQPVVCTADSLPLTDAAGDATQAAVADTPGPSQADLDLLDGRLDWDGSTLRVRLHVTDLGADGLPDEYFRAALATPGRPVIDLTASREAGADDSFSATSGGDVLDPTAEETSATLTGSFDETTDVVTIEISPASYAALIPGKRLADGDVVSLGAVLGQRNTGLLTLTADTAAGLCPSTLTTSTATASASATPTATTEATTSSTTAPATTAPATTAPSTTAPGTTTPATTAPSTTAPAGASTVGGRYSGLVSPRRVLDSRDGTGTAAGRKTGSVLLDLSGALPEAATAVVLNVTVQAPSAAGHVVVYPDGTAQPASSNVNFATGQTQANEVVVRLPASKRVRLDLSGASTQLIADLVGWFATDGGLLTPLPTPTRALDTRTTSTPRRTGEVVVDLSDRLPADATAVVLNVTVTGADRAGHVVAWGTGLAKPATSNVNAGPGQVQANEVITQLGAGRKVSLSLERMTAGLVVDVVASVSPPSAGGQALSTLASPVRLMDSRNGTGTSTGRKSGDVVLTLPSSVPAGSTAVLNVTSTGALSPGFVTAYGSSSRPETSNVNFRRGLAQANEVLVAVRADRTVVLHVGGAGSPSTHLVVDLVGHLA